jgi:hypothetical protein
MTDRIVQYPGRYKLTLVAGTTDTYDLEAVPGTITATGTPYNKASVLTDATAALMGLPATAVPDEMFKALVNFRPFVIGSYTGDNSASRIIALDFQPSFVIIFGVGAVVSKTSEMSISNSSNASSGGTWRRTTNATYTIVETGFTVSTSDKEADGTSTNENDQVYQYIAFM